MRRRIFVFVLALLMALTLAGCADGAKIANESRSGVVRVLHWYNDYEVRFYDADGTLREDFGSYISKEYWSYGSGTAFGVGKKVGKETNTFVTNRHVLSSGLKTATLPWNFVLSETSVLDPSLYQKLANLHAEYPDVNPKAQCEPTGVFILLDDYAFRDGVLDMDRVVECKVVYIGNEYEPDLAVIQTLDGEPVPGRVALPLLGPSEKVESGDSVYALGYPGVTDDKNPTLAASVERVTVTNGIASLHSQFVNSSNPLTDIIQHTAQINQGNSGGPLLDARGAVVGVNTWGWGQDDSSSEPGVQASIEIYYVRDRLDDLDIPYGIYSPINWLLVGIISAAVVVVAAAVVLVLVLRKKKGKAMVPPQPQPQPQPGPGAVPASGPAPAQEYRIQGISGAFAGRRFAIKEGEPVRIGTDPSANDLVFPAGTSGVSRRHCVLTLKNGQLWLQDVGSTYGTMAGAQRLVKDQPIVLRMGDRFSLGSDQQSFAVTGKGGV